MQLLSIFGPILFAIYLVVAQSTPADDNYVIINRGLSTGGNKLAITFNQPGQPPIMTPLVGGANQTWALATYNVVTQTITSVANTGQQVSVGSGDSFLMMGSPVFAVWSIYSSTVDSSWFNLFTKSKCILTSYTPESKLMVTPGLGLSGVLVRMPLSA
ncbi:hypothetical protein M422DRAFT_272417 [Sphaerobolus stellatus SS14]|uniref:CCL2-like lectin domain-containing protein n=1 Tax=Sphaerobolus stellatus (strain SS14) TaxID=990650 RepID=A0A0C9TXG4_SPHS4|nr:hypothetical protein M422DRAFT_272417 [Sphaerobolus stellatus SS14]